MERSYAIERELEELKNEVKELKLELEADRCRAKLGAICCNWANSEHPGFKTGRTNHRLEVAASAEARFGAR